MENKIVNKKWMIGLVVLMVSAMLLLSATPAMSAQEASTGAQVIVPEYIEVGLNLSVIDFGTVDTGTTGNALSGSGWPVLINITENTNVITNISVNASGGGGTSDYCTAACANSFTVNNHTYSNTSAFTYSGALNVDGSYDTEPFVDWGGINPPGVGANTTLYIYNKMTIPAGQIAGTYTLANDNGAINVKVQKES